MSDSIPIYFKSLFLAAFCALLAQAILRLIPPLRKYYIPRAFIGGIIALLAGNQGLGQFFDIPLVSENILNSWNELSLFFVNVVFACIFLGRTIPGLKKSINLAIPQASLGQTLAWGQYFTGGLITLFVLIPFFGLNESVASFIEISFQGGIGVAVGMGETFKSIGLENAKSITVALAPLAMLTGIFSGIIMINYKNKRKTIHLEEQEQNEKTMKEITINSFQNSFIVQLAIIGIAMFLGVLLLTLLKFTEENLLIGSFYNEGFVKYIPFFPMAMLGGAVLQLFIGKIIPIEIINRRTIKRIQIFALDAVIIMAIGTIELSIIMDNIILVLVLLVSGSIWNITCFLLTYKALIPKYSFEKGIADYGQSMGTTSIGLMFQSIVDKKNKSKGKEAFAIKQLLFEPFVGGGIITGLSPIIIQKIGLIYFTGISFFLTLIFFLGGYFYKKYRIRDED